jgi:hypothetical protein
MADSTPPGKNDLPDTSAEAVVHRSFKSDAEFLAYISMGAAGVRKTVENLRISGTDTFIPFGT